MAKGMRVCIILPYKGLFSYWKALITITTVTSSLPRGLDCTFYWLILYYRGCTSAAIPAVNARAQDSIIG